MYMNEKKTAAKTAPSTTFSTMNRKLEQVLFNHGIMFTSQHRNEDLMNVWTYERTPELERIVSLFRESHTNRLKTMQLAYKNPRIMKGEQ